MLTLLLAGMIAAGPPGTPPAPEGTPPPVAPGGSALGRLLLLPDLSAIGRVALAWNRLDVAAESPRGGPFAPGGKVEPVFQELELALQAVVDPYARADVFLSFGPDGAAVEEATLTALALPGGFQVRAGTLFAPFGRLNQQHPHAWDFVDGSLAQSRLLAPESLKGPGLDVAWLAPLPWFAELHLAYQATTPVEGAGARRTAIARLLQYLDLASGATLGLGLSAARLDEPGPAAWRDLLGADVHLRLRPPQGRRWLALQGEIFQRRLSRAAAPDPDGAATRLGGYAQAFWRADASWGLGLRWETAPSLAAGRPGPEQRFGALASWFPSEFQRLRLQISEDRLPGGRRGLEALLSLEWAIGAHGAHPF